MTRDDQARQRLVEIAQRAVEQHECEACRGQGYVERLYDGMITDYACDECWGLKLDPLCLPNVVRSRAGFQDPKKGPWCAAGLTAAMDQAGLLVPASGTPARRGAIALFDFVYVRSPMGVKDGPTAVQEWTAPGDIIAWKQHPEPEEWKHVAGAPWQHAFYTCSSQRSMCGKATRADVINAAKGSRCTSCVWETRKGHVAVIVAVDDISLTTVGWNEGPSPGRVMMRRLWRDPERTQRVNATVMGWSGWVEKRVPRSSTVLWRRPGGIYGIARPVAA